MNLRKLFIFYLKNKIKNLKKIRLNTEINFPKKLYQCGNCTKKIGDLTLFYTHRQRCITTSGVHVSCPICKKLVKTKSIKQHLKLHSSERHFLCQGCGSTFSQLPGLWLHIKQAHEPNVSYQCRFCSLRFKSQPQLWNHEWAHKNPDGISCDLCSKIFKAPNLLNNHKINVHRKTAKAEFSTKNLALHHCSECDHRFSTKQQLIRHKVKHSKEKPFTCALCGQCFGWKRSLNAHIKQFHTAFLFNTVDTTFLEALNTFS